MEKLGKYSGLSIFIFAAIFLANLNYAAGYVTGRDEMAGLTQFEKDKASVESTMSARDKGLPLAAQNQIYKAKIEWHNADKQLGAVNHQINILQNTGSGEGSQELFNLRQKATSLKQIQENVHNKAECVRLRHGYTGGANGKTPIDVAASMRQRILHEIRMEERSRQGMSGYTAVPLNQTTRWEDKATRLEDNSLNFQAIKPPLD